MSMNDTTLFRQEAVENKRNQNIGTIFINTPVHYQAFIVGITVILIALVVIICHADFSEKFIVRGFINSTQGIVPVFPRREGIIVQSYCHSGQSVHKGDKLFRIDSSYDGFHRQKKFSMVGLLEKEKKRLNENCMQKNDKCMRSRPYW